MGERILEGVFGYDYGIKPRVMVTGDIEFPELLRSSFIALGYGELPQFGDLANIPSLTMAFKNNVEGRECFAHFKRWSDGSNDGDAVGIGFIEFKTGEYGICIYPEYNRLVKRSIPEMYLSEVEPIIIVVGHIKMFPQTSEGYKWFKSKVNASQFVLAPGTLTSKRPMLDLAITKREIHFYQEDEIPEYAMEAAILQSQKVDVDEYRPTTSKIKPSVKEIYERREAQLSRFFPVTVERLRLNKDFYQVKKQLDDEGYQDWQTLQAACNITLKQRVPELFKINKDIPDENQNAATVMNILSYLLNNYEDVSLQCPPIEIFSVEKLREQIQADAFELIRYIAEPNVPEILPDGTQKELIKYGIFDLGEQ